MDKNLAHYVVVTVIPVNEDKKFLICKRAPHEKAFANKWTVPGGKLEVLDYVLDKKDTLHHWYNVLENTAKKEVKEEVGLDIEDIGYVTSMVYIREDKIPCLIVSLYASCSSEKVVLDESLSDFAWVSLEEAREYDLIEGIYEELVILNEKLSSGKNSSWSKGMLP